MIIGKYALQVTDAQMVHMPIGAEILSVQFQKTNGMEQLQLWALINPDVYQMELRTISIVGTGNYCDRPGKFIGMVQEAGGALVWHVFDATVKRVI